MGKKKPTDKKEEQADVKRYCKDCANGTFDTQFLNLDIYGQPTLIICKFEQWKKLREEQCSNGKFVHK